MSKPVNSQSKSFDRLQQGKRLWMEVLQSEYLKEDSYDRSLVKIKTLIAPIRKFLEEEDVQNEDRPNAARSLGLLLNLLGGSDPKQKSEFLSLAFMKMGLALTGLERDNRGEFPPASDHLDSDLGLAEITAAIEKDGEGYVARTGHYSSIYAVLLALLLDEITIREQVDSLALLFEDPAVLNQVKKPVMKPGPLFLTNYYRGQPHDWPPLPKALRKNDARSTGIKRLFSRLRELLAEARFGAGVSQLGLPKLGREQLDAIRQHYGFATSLLDFTTNIEVAAFFATNNASEDDSGVIYRYHLAHPYALVLMGSHTATVKEVGDREMIRQMEEVGVKALESLKVVLVDGVERISRQDGVFIHGIQLWAAHNFFQPVYFRQQKGEVYTNMENKITEEWLFPVDDPLAKLAQSILPTP